MSMLNINGKNVECELLIFDKDGTIVDFSCWIPIMQKRFEFLNSKLKIATPESIYKALGIEDNNGDFLVIRGGNVFSSRQKTMMEVQTALITQKIDASIDLIRESFEFADKQVTMETQVKSIVNNPVNFFKTLYDSGIKLSVATGDNKSRAEKVLEFLKIKKFFGITVGRDCVKDEKPSPEFVDIIMEHFNVSTPENVYVVGDSICDIEMAKNSKTKSIAVLTGNNSKKELKSVSPDFLINDISEIKLKH